MRYSTYCTKTGWGDSIVAVKRGNIWFPVALFHWLLQHSCWQRQRQQRWIIKHQTLIFDQEGRLTQAGEMKRMFWHRTLKKIWTKSLMSQAPPTKPLQGANQAHSQGWDVAPDLLFAATLLSKHFLYEGRSIFWLTNVSVTILNNHTLTPVKLHLRRHLLPKIAPNKATIPVCWSHAS